MIVVASRPFAAGIAARHGSTSVRPRGVARVVASARVIAVAGRGVGRGTLQLALTVRHAHAIERFHQTVERSRRSIVERVTRHEVTAARTIERTQRVEALPARAVAPQRAADASPPDTAPRPAVALAAPAVARVMRQPNVVATPADTPVRAPRAAPPSSRPQPLSLPAHEIARVTDEVMRSIDRRLGAYRERRGRS